jgi:hypothetical protein
MPRRSSAGAEAGLGSARALTRSSPGLHAGPGARSICNGLTRPPSQTLRPMREVGTGRLLARCPDLEDRFLQQPHVAGSRLQPGQFLLEQRLEPGLGHVDAAAAGTAVVGVSAAGALRPARRPRKTRCRVVSTKPRSSHTDDELLVSLDSSLPLLSTHVTRRLFRLRKVLAASRPMTGC